ncbi:hypothetical protein Emag_002161 [Eimeria magna]
MRMRMGSLKLICLAGVSLAYLEGAHGMEADSERFSGSRAKCLNELNHYRLAAGFSAFTESNILPLQDQQTDPSKEGSEAGPDEELKFFKYACNSLQSENPAPFTKDATFAVHSQSGAEADCSAAVEFWKGAIANFDSLPPEYQEQAASYADMKHVSFVALFNPKPNAAVDCAYVTCQKTTAKPNPDASGQGGERPGETPSPGVVQSPSSTSTPAPSTTSATSPPTDDGLSGTEEELLQEVRGSQADERTGSVQVRRLAVRGGEAGDTITGQSHLLVCVTTPAALEEGKRPFT